MNDKKDEIIAMQLEVIRSMTESNLRRIGADMWGGSKKSPSPLRQDDAPASPTANVASAVESPVEEVHDNPPAEESLDDLRSELDSYIGLAAVKEEVKSLINLAAVYKMRREADLPVADMSLHMVFSGNPGTGKTMIARFMARVYKALGILSKGHLTEVDRSGLVAGFVGQTAMKTAKVIEAAKGGVLFIDEAYTLTDHDGNDFGQEAVDTLLKAMEDQRDELVVIAAGYTDKMDKFISSNPGLRSRFNKYLHFEDYTPEEMAKIFKMNCEKSCYTLSEECEKRLVEVLAEKSTAGDFGNARGVRNLFERALTAQATRLAAETDVSREMLMELRPEDLG